MTEYRVHYMPDEMLDGRDFVLLSEPGECVTLYLRRGVRDLPDAENCAVWEEAWAAFRELARVGVIPAQRAYAL